MGSALFNYYAAGELKAEGSSITEGLTAAQSGAEDFNRDAALAVVNQKIESLDFAEQPRRHHEISPGRCTALDLHVFARIGGEIKTFQLLLEASHINLA